MLAVLILIQSCCDQLFFFFFFIDKMFVFHSVARFLICLIVLFLSFLGTINQRRRRKMEEKAPRQLVKVSLPHWAVPLCLHV